MIRRQDNRLFRLVAATLMAWVGMTLVAGCGGSAGAGAQGGASAGTGAGASDLTVQLTADKATLSSDGKAPVTLTATVVDGSGIARALKAVEWKIADPVSPIGVRLENVQTKTDGTGKAGATLALSGNPTNRSVSVTATSEGASASMTVDVAGTTLALSGPQTVSLNGTPSRYTINLRDSGGLGIARQTLTVTSSAGNRLSTGSPVTDASGQATFELTGTVAGTDTLSVSGIGAGTTFAVNVANESLAVIVPSTDLPIGVNSNVAVTYSKAGGIPVGATVTLNSTRGTVSPSTASIASGTATFTITSTTAGPATIYATVGTTQSAANANFVSTTPARIDLQGTPNIIGPNQPGQTTERSTLLAVVRDAAGNPVKGAMVAFANPIDPSGGTIDPAVGLTDASGLATSAFIAGPTATAPYAVQLTAQVLGTTVPAAAFSLSVSRQTLFVRVETDNVIEKVPDPPIYRKRYAVVVTDSTGNAVPGAEVQIKLTPTKYATGYYCLSQTVEGSDPPYIDCHVDGGRWLQKKTGEYPSEDVNKDGVCQAGEDANLDRQLTPGNVASTSAGVTTDASGVSTILVSYPQGFATWVEVFLEVTVRVGGTEGANGTLFWLPISADDLNDKTKPPPGATSPFPYTTFTPRCP